MLWQEREFSANFDVTNSESSSSSDSCTNGNASPVAESVHDSYYNDQNNNSSDQNIVSINSGRRQKRRFPQKSENTFLFSCAIHSPNSPEVRQFRSPTTMLALILRVLLHQAVLIM